MGLIRSLIGEAKAAVTGALTGESSSKKAPAQAPYPGTQTQPRGAAYDPHQGYPQQGYAPPQAYAPQQGYDPVAHAQPYPPQQGYAPYPPQGIYTPPPQHDPAAAGASHGLVNPATLPYIPVSELQRASDLLAQADEELHQAYEEAKKKGGLVDATKTLGMAAYSQVMGQEGGPTYSEAAKRVVHDGRKPAIPLVESAYHKIQEAEAILNHDLGVSKAEIKGPKASTAVLAQVFHFGPIHAIVKASHKKKAIEHVKEMMEELRQARVAVDAALRRAKAAHGQAPAASAPPAQIL